MNYYMNVYMLMNYDMECICWIDMMILWRCNWTMYIYEIIMLMLSLLLMSSSRQCRTLLLMLSLLLMSSSRWSCTLLLIKLLSPCILLYSWGLMPCWILIIHIALILGIYTPALCLGVCYSSVVFEELFAPVGL